MIALIDYDAGNTCSVMNALKRLNADFVLTDDHDKIQSADKVIFPGVGHAGAAMEALKRKDLVNVIKNLNQPTLGICVGLQLMCNASEEGDTQCLGIIDSGVRRFDSNNGVKVPHMGWNQIQVKGADPIWDDVVDNSYCYFVHSYYMPVTDYTIGICDYSVSFTAVARKDNFWGTQCHIEKSGEVGAQLLANFVNGKL